MQQKQLNHATLSQNILERHLKSREVELIHIVRSFSLYPISNDFQNQTPDTANYSFNLFYFLFFFPFVTGTVNLHIYSRVFRKRDSNSVFTRHFPFPSQIILNCLEGQSLTTV